MHSDCVPYGWGIRLSGMCYGDKSNPFHRRASRLGSFTYSSRPQLRSFCIMFSSILWTFLWLTADNTIINYSHLLAHYLRLKTRHRVFFAIIQIGFGFLPQLQFFWYNRLIHGSKRNQFHNISLDRLIKHQLELLVPTWQVLPFSAVIATSNAK